MPAPPNARPPHARPAHPRHGPARPDHRSPHARSHRCGFADGSVEPNHDGSRGRCRSIRDGISAPTGSSPGNGSGRARPARRAGSGPQCPPPPMPAPRIPVPPNTRLPHPRHGPARPDHRSPHARSHRCGFTDGSVEPNHDGLARTVPFHPRRYFRAHGTSSPGKRGAVRQAERGEPPPAVPQRPPPECRPDTRLPHPRHGPARPDHRSPHARSHRCGFTDGSVEPNHDGPRPRGRCHSIRDGYFRAHGICQPGGSHGPAERRAVGPPHARPPECRPPMPPSPPTPLPVPQMPVMSWSSPRHRSLPPHLIGGSTGPSFSPRSLSPVWLYRWFGRAEP